MNVVEAKAKQAKLRTQYPDGSHKSWEAYKKFAKETGIDTKVFNKGLGQQYDKLSGLLKGANEVHNLVGVDDRTFKAFPAEKAKLDKIIEAYKKIIAPNLRDKSKVQFWAWWCLDAALKDMQQWADGVVAEAARLAKKYQRQ